MRKLLKKLSTISKISFESSLHLVSIVFFVKLKYLKHWKPEKMEKQNVVIIGNGPSLKNEFTIIEEFLNRSQNDFDFICVNTFATSKFYEIIKPSKYVIVDPLFFTDTTEDISLNIKRDSITKSLINKTSWPVSLYIPRYYVKSYFVQSLANNDYIDIKPLNNIPLEGGVELFKHILFKLRLGNPVGQNVMITATFLGIQKKYKKIFLFGADHSWLCNLKVLHNNFITLDDKHIDESDENVIVLKEQDGRPKKLPDFVNQLYVMFREYHVLSNYATKANTEILNMTKGSFIDAFKKG